jgi:hypothetical protein
MSSFLFSSFCFHAGPERVKELALENLALRQLALIASGYTRRWAACLRKNSSNNLKTQPRAKFAAPGCSFFENNRGNDENPGGISEVVAGGEESIAAPDSSPSRAPRQR